METELYSTLASQVINFSHALPIADSFIAFLTGGFIFVWKIRNFYLLFLNNPHNNSFWALFPEEVDKNLILAQLRAKGESISSRCRLGFNT